MRSSLASLPLVAALSIVTSARAQTTSDDLRTLIANDLTAIGVNLPVWMSQHIPAVMAPVGLGAGSGIGDDSGGVSIGVLTRLGFFNHFEQVGHGLQLVDLQPALPSLVPWPQFGVVLGVGLGDGLELGADVQFIPPMDIAGDKTQLKASLISLAATLRWRLNKPHGALPALVLGLGAAYYSGSFLVGRGFSSPYSETLEGHPVTGTVRIDAAPGVDWSIVQATPEVRVAWDIGGVFRPYVGLGVGLSFGEVGDTLHVRGEATIDTIDGQPANEDPVVYEDDVVLFSTEPALWTLRPHVGFDVVLGAVALTAQLDLAVMGKDKVDGDFSDAAGSFDTEDPDFLYNENARKAQTQSALIFTLAVRAVF